MPRMNIIVKFARKFMKYLRSLFLHIKIKDKNITILSNNCIAGFIYSDYHLKFNSPTINLSISPNDFIKFCKNLQHYIDSDLIEVINPDINSFIKIGGDKINFPVGLLDDIIIYFQHSNNFLEAKYDWDRRKSRIIKDKIYIILVDTFCDRKLIEDFMSIDFNHKIFLTGENLDISANTFYIAKLKANKALWYYYTNRFKTKKYYQYFKFHKWVNNSNYYLLNSFRLTKVKPSQ